MVEVGHWSAGPLGGTHAIFWVNLAPLNGNILLAPWLEGIVPEGLNYRPPGPPGHFHIGIISPPIAVGGRRIC